MHRGNASDADLVLDIWPWRFRDLADAETVHHTLAGYRGARWLDWSATRRRWQAAAPGDVQEWCATLPPGHTQCDSDAGRSSVGGGEGSFYL